jgi:hypothetical protein
MSLSRSQAHASRIAVAVIGAALCILPTAARGQSRGSLQATATVVPSAASTAGLAQALSAAGNWAAHRPMSNDAATLAQASIVAVDQGGQQGALVVSVSYLKN